MVDKEVFLESTAAVVLGIIIALPVSYLCLVVTQKLGFTLMGISITQTIVFTIVAFLRKYAVRLWFKNKNAGS
jgi:hypothetical protein